MKHLYFIRHGESVMNTQGVVSGHTNTPLTEKGKKQAQKAGIQARNSDIKFDIILSSPLQRAHHTAKEIAKHTNHSEDNIQLLEMLKERNFGQLEGKTLEDFGVNGEIYVSDTYSIDHVPKVEKAVELQQRADEALEYIRSLPQDTILVVSHGSFGRALQRSAKKLPITEFGERLDNAQIIKLI